MGRMFSPLTLRGRERIGVGQGLERGRSKRTYCTGERQQDRAGLSSKGTAGGTCATTGGLFWISLRCVDLKRSAIRTRRNCFGQITAVVVLFSG